MRVGITFGALKSVCENGTVGSNKLENAWCRVSLLIYVD